MNDMGRLGYGWQILLGSIVAVVGGYMLVHRLGWFATAGIFFVAFGLTVVNGVKIPKKQQTKGNRGKKRR